MSKLPSHARRAGGVILLFASLAVQPAAAHTDDPKILDRQPAYVGPGYRADLAGPTTGIPLGFPASGLMLESWLPLAEFGSPDNANDIWGYVSPSGREYALLGHSSGTSFIEVTNPGNAQVIDTIAGPVSLWSDVKVYGEYAYAVNEGTGAGIQVFDLSDIDNGNVSLVTTINTGGTTSTHNVAINEETGFLYRCGGSNSTGLRIYDLASPANPVLVGTWNTRYVHDLQVITMTSGPFAGREIAFCCSGFNGGWTETGLDILDVTDKSQIVEVGRIVYSNGQYSHQLWVSEDRSKVYLNDELDEDGAIFTRTFVFDVSQLSNPTLAGTFENDSTAIGHNLYIRGDLIFEANYRSGLRVFDASDDPLNPTEIAYFDTYPENDAASFNGLWSNYPYLPSGTIIGSDIEKGLFVWSMQSPQASIAFADLPGETISPAGADFDVELTELEPGGILPGTAMLHYSVNEDFVAAPLVAQGGGIYTAPFGSTPCGDTIRYYLSVDTANGATVTSPSGAPATTFSAFSANGIALISSDTMESSTGYSVENVALDDGAWSRGIPAGLGDRGDPTTDFDGSGACWLTDNVAGNSDVDGGPTRLLTPQHDLSTLNDPIVSYAWWFTNDDGDADRLDVEVSSDGGSSWKPVHSHASSGGWQESSFRLLDYTSATSTVKFRFSATDNPNDSVTEAAIDALRISDMDCAADVPGDVDGDGVVGFSDLLALLATWGPCPGCAADFDGNGIVDFGDLLTLLGGWTTV